MRKQGVSSKPLQSSRPSQPKRRRGASPAREPEVEEEVGRSALCGGNLPRGTRRSSPRRIRNLKARKGLELEVMANTFLLGPFQFLRNFLAQLREKVHELQARRFSSRTTLGIAVFVAILHWLHLVTLFENDRHFSHLSSLEREMSFRTEMGLYYSYFKTIIEAPSFLEGLWMIMNDRLTEYPLVINTVKRFHLYPEVSHHLRQIIFVECTEIIMPNCFRVIYSLNSDYLYLFKGLGDPACFYVGVIFILNGLMMGLFFMYGAYLSGTQLGGVITVLCFFFNHGEATRVMWTPPLRESFSYPFLVLQMYILTLILSFKHPLGVLGCIALQIRATAVQHEQYGHNTYLHGVSIRLRQEAIILKRNEILKLGVSKLNFWLIQGSAWWFGTIILKFLTSKILGVSDHIRLSDLIAARILRYTDFDTLIYTCAPEFDFMEKATPLRYTKTLLLPVVMVITCFIFKKTIRDISCVLATNIYLRKQLLEHGELAFHTLQLLAFTALAILIMRLKLFLTPHMCVMASLICSRQLFGWLFRRVRFENVIFGILTVMSIQGYANLHNQWNIIGEFNNLPQEELLQWIKYNTTPGV
nr:probable C-mannosyltransferase DPY19L2 [Macaca fascicularis]